MIDTGHLLADAFAVRLPRNADVLIRPGDCVALYSGAHALPVYAPHLHTPEDADCYALRAMPQAHPFGMAKLGTYVLPEYPCEVFHLGFSGEMHLSLAHLTGLRPLLSRLPGDSGSLKSLMDDPFLSRQMRTAVSDTITQMYGCNWEYPRIAAARAELTEACMQALFPLLYSHGLLLHPRRFVIRRISPPILTAR